MKKQILALALASITACTMLSTTACTQEVDNRSAYQIAVDNGFVGTEAEWLASLKGEKGDNGVNGTNGVSGKSAYELAVENGFEGTQEEWLLSIVGKTGVGIAKVEATVTNELKITMTDGTEYTVLVDHCDHEFAYETTNPTCMDLGYNTYTCTKCELSYINDYVPALGHHYVDKECFFCKEAEPFGEIEVDTSWYDPTAVSYEITTKNQMAGIAYLVNNGVTNFSGKQINLADNIDLGNAEWIPIGTSAKPFAGTFDGRYFSIKNLKISNQTSYVGLFGNVTGVIKRFSVENANVSVEHIGNYVSIACGYCTTKIEGIHTSGYINAPNCTHVGGVIGCAIQSVVDCSNSADIIGNTYVGGILGFGYHTYTWAAWNLDFVNLHNSGDITASGVRVGGVIGSIHYGEASGQAGIVTLNILSNSGTISGGSYVGGVGGEIWATADQSGVSYVVASEICNFGDVDGQDIVGGLFGYLGSEGASTLKVYTQTGIVTGTERWDTLGKIDNITISETA